MAGDKLVIEFSSVDELQSEFENNLRHGGAFAEGATGFVRGQECELVLVHPNKGGRISFNAGVSIVVPDGNKKGVGVAINDFSSGHRKQLEEFVNGRGRIAQEPKKKGTASVHERLRGLSTAQQKKMAHSRNLNERVALERIYGKFVWETLLRNSCVTIPEVSRMARMGNLPRPLLELIVSNGAWINTPHVRRAVLSNPRLTGEMINKVVRVMPRNELKLAKKQTSYSQAVRIAAQKFLKE